jgi:hypothetical protein
MSIVKTPFGEIELESKPISFFITDSSLGTKREVRFEGIRSMTESGQFAQIVWTLWQYDKEDNLVNELEAVQGRQIITPVSGENRVNSNGILILRESFSDTEEGQLSYQKAYDNGHNEYKYWLALLRVAPLPTVISAAGNLLAQYQRFDRP